jgi:predicted RNA polymerase sigma factor
MIARRVETRRWTRPRRRAATTGGQDWLSPAQRHVRRAGTPLASGDWRSGAALRRAVRPCRGVRHGGDASREAVAGASPFRTRHTGAVSDATEEAKAAIGAVWRDHAGSMLGVLARRLGDLDLAEDALQDAMAEALAHWPVEGVPRQPAGWLVTTAWRKAIDRLRRETAGAQRLAALARERAPEPTDDDRLALVFACCHPTLSQAAQVALTLHAACGLATEEIAAAFLVPIPTMAQRLVRAKRKLRDERVRFSPPEESEIPERLPSVLAVIYLVFNEGYLSSELPQRRELAREGLELARQVARMLSSEPEAAGLAALVELHEARAEARFDAQGRLVLMEEQDRGRWDRTVITRAVARLQLAMDRDRPGPYQVQAAIAAQHALADSFERTDWAAVRALYDMLDALAPSPVVRLNRAVATRFIDGPEVALAEVDALASQLGEYRLLHATRAELLRALGREVEAREALTRALAMATNPAERDLLRRRLDGH